MNSSGVLISLSGIDGVGKSTLASWIQKHLAEDYGLHSHYVWCKFGDHPLSRYRLERFVKQGGFNKPKPARRRSKPTPSYLYRAYGGMFLALHLAQIAITVRGLLKRKKIIVCDRYIFDTMVDLEQELHYSTAQVHSLLAASWIPQPDSKFLLDLPEQVAFARKPDSDSIEFLRERRALYLHVANEYKLNVIDASQSIDDVGQTIIQRIMEDNFQKEPICQ